MDEQQARDARIARLRAEQDRLNEIEKQQEQRLSELERVRQAMEADLKRRQAEVDRYREVSISVFILHHAIYLKIHFLPISESRKVNKVVESSLHFQIKFDNVECFPSIKFMK